MKKHIKTLFSLILSIALVYGMTETAFAAESIVTYRGRAEGFAFEPGSGYSQTDLFEDFKDVMPGDQLEEAVTVVNQAEDSDYIKVYMKAVVHDEEGNPLTYDEAFENRDGKDQANVSGERDETVVSMADFLAQLTMRVYNGDQLIYEASPDEAGTLADPVLLGTLDRREAVGLKIELDVPIALGNEYADRVGEVDWVFLAEEYFEQPQTPDTPQPTPAPTPSTPATGDQSMAGFFLGAAGVSAVMLLLLLLYKKRKAQK